MTVNPAKLRDAVLVLRRAGGMHRVPRRGAAGKDGVMRMDHHKSWSRKVRPDSVDFNLGGGYKTRVFLAAKEVFLELPAPMATARAARPGTLLRPKSAS